MTEHENEVPVYKVYYMYTDSASQPKELCLATLGAQIKKLFCGQEKLSLISLALYELYKRILAPLLPCEHGASFRDIPTPCPCRIPKPC